MNPLPMFLPLFFIRVHLRSSVAKKFLPLLSNTERREDAIQDIVSGGSPGDEFNDSSIASQWRWQANPKPGWAFPVPPLGSLRLYASPTPEGAKIGLFTIRSGAVPENGYADYDWFRVE